MPRPGCPAASAAARRAWTEALRIFQEIEHPDADLVRARLGVERVGLVAAAQGAQVTVVESRVVLS